MEYIDHHAEWLRTKQPRCEGTSHPTCGTGIFVKPGDPNSVVGVGRGPFGWSQHFLSSCEDSSECVDEQVGV